MGKASPPLLPTLCLVLLASCSVPVPPSSSALNPVLSGSGAAALSILLPQGPTPSRVTLTASAPGITSLTLDLTFSNGVWSGLLEHIPAGANRSFLAQAYDASHTLIFEGTISSVSIPPRQITLVIVPLHAVEPPAVSHEPPRIVSATQSSDTVSPEQVLTFEVAVENPRGGALTFSWEANMGTLSLPQSRSTTSRVTWKAPDCTAGNALITLTVLDDLGRTVLQSFSPPGLPVCHWASTGTPNSPRIYHTATRLPSGEVLVSGGESHLSTATTEIYEPASDTWRVTGSMNTPREGHTATLLPDGRVLAVGGLHSATGILETAEVYDPASGTWSPTGSMAIPRMSHTATPLPGGQVLVAGGFNSVTGTVWTAEVYDLASGTWSPTGAMTFPRRGHTAMALLDGKVLVVGGAPVAEVYDPATGTWSPTGPMAVHRERFAATLLPDGRVLVSGGNAGAGDLTTVELYDPATNAWSVSSPMNMAHASHTATVLLDGKVLVYGSPLVKWAELYDPDSDTWSLAGTPGAPRTEHEATLLLDGQVLISGGKDSIAGDEHSSSLYSP